VALFPGGFGTLNEAMEVLALLQTGKRYPMPLVLVDEPGGTYWSNWKQYLEEELAARGYIGPDDFSLFSIFDAADAAFAIIDRFYRRYHSLRFVRGRLVIRLNSRVSDGPSALNVGKTAKDWERERVRSRLVDQRYGDHGRVAEGCL
jgi:hypothetical protein